MSEKLSTLLDKNLQHNTSEEIRKKYSTPEARTSFLRAITPMVEKHGLDKFNQSEVVQIFLQIANLNLPLANSDLIYILPYKGKLKLIIKAQAYIFLAQRDPSFKLISKGVVYEGDEPPTEVIGENGSYIKHTKSLIRNSRKIVGAYVCTEHRGKSLVTFVDAEKLQMAKDASTTSKDPKAKYVSPWLTCEADMCEKVAIRRHFGFFNLTPETQKLDKIDNEDYDLPKQVVDITPNQKQDTKQNAKDFFNRPTQDVVECENEDAEIDNQL